MKTRLLVFSFILILIQPLKVSSQEKLPIFGAADSILLQSVEIIGFRPLRDNKERSSLSQLEIMSHDAGAALTRLPSVSAIRKGGGYGFDPVLRGFKYDQLGILIDGIQTTTVACPNRMDPPTSQVSVNSLSSVEVHKGPYSLRYGNHIGGVINFITANPANFAEPGYYSRISTGFESNGNIWRTEALAGMTGEKADYQLAGSWHRGNDYLDGNGDLVPASFTRANLSFRGLWRPSEKQEFNVRLTRNFARDADYPALPMDLRSDDTWLMHLSNTAYLGEGSKMKLKTSAYASLVDHLMDNYDKQLEPRMVDAETPVQTRNIGARTELQIREGNRWIHTGIDLNYENADGSRTREFLMGPNAGKILTDNVWQNGQIVKGGVFMEYIHMHASLRYNLSGRLNVNSAKALNPDSNFASLYENTTSTQFNPGITGGVEYLGNIFSYALWAGRVQRSGNLSERYMNSFPVGLDPYELIGNPDLKPEVNNQADLIISFRGNNSTRMEVDLFYAYLQNFISSSIRPDLTPKMPTAPGVRQYDNIDRTSIIGFELSMQQDLLAGLTGNLKLASRRGMNLELDEPLPEIPPMDLRISLDGSYLKDKLRPSVTFRYVQSQERISAEFGETATPSFWLLDLVASYKAFDKLLFSAGVRNLLDVAYYEHLNRSVKGTPGAIYNPGRNIYAGITIEF